MRKNQIRISTEPFRVKKDSDTWKHYYNDFDMDIEGHMTKESIWRWLESQGAVRLNKNNVPAVIVEDNKPAKFQTLLDELQKYEEEEQKQSAGNFGVKDLQKWTKEITG